MSGKSIFLSVLSAILFGGMVFLIVYMFKFYLVAGIAGILLLAIPEIVRRKALDAADGVIDKLLAKYIVPVLFVLMTLASILGVGFWLNLFN